jgi:sugar phosphate isomerase/epimerase
MQRREFVQKSLGAVSLLAIGGCGHAAEPRQAEPEPDMKAEPRIGVQLYTVRTLLENDFEGTINEIARIGYREVELHSLFGRTSHEVRGILDGAGLAAPAWHVGADDLRSNVEVIIEEAICLGSSWIVCPYIDASERTLEGYRKVADELNTAGRACSDAGISFAYHNHDFEFTPVEDTIPYDLLLERCDEKLVQMELDIFWITKGGANPLEYFDRYPGRFPLCHVKDMAPDGAMVDVGAGIIDFKTIFASAEQAGLKHYFVEHDEPADPIASVTASFAGLKSVLNDPSSRTQ